MRIRQLQLIKYGRFDGCVLPFDLDGCDLHLIVGPNEAGKSTTLNAVSDLLFGFEARTRYAFRFDRQVLRVGAVIEEDGEAFEIRRRKGNAQTVLGPDDLPMSETQLTAALAGQTRESFTRMFGLDQERLRAGGKAVLDASDEVGQAIFAAGSGLVQVAQTCRELEEEAKAIWSNRGSNRTYSNAADDYKTARALLKEVEVRAPEWARSRRALNDAEEELGRLRRARDELKQQELGLQRRRRVLSSAARRGQMIEQLRDLGPTPEMTEETVTNIEAAMIAKDRAETDKRTAADNLSMLSDELAANRPPSHVLELRSEMEALRNLQGGVERTRAAKSGLDVRHEQANLRLAETARELDWPLEDAKTLKAKLPARPTLADVKELIERRSGIDQQLKTTRDAVSEADAALARAHKEASDAPAPIDLKPLVALVRDLRDQGLLEAVERTGAQLKELSDLSVERLAALHPWDGDLTALRTLTLPSDEDVEAVLSRISAARSRLELENQAAVQTSEQLDQAELQLRQSVLAHPAPSFEMLSNARSARDSSWTPLRSHLTGEKAIDRVDDAIVAFENDVAVTDRLADERLASAEHTGGMAELEREIERKRLGSTQAQARQAAAAEALSSGQLAFDNLTRACGIALSPEAFPAWRDAVVDVLETARARDTAEGDAADACRAEAEGRTALIALMGIPANDPDSSDLRRLLANADRLIDAANDASARAAAHKAALAAAEDAENRARTRATAAQSAEADWTAEWKPALVRARLPADTTLAAAKVRLDLIESVRAEIDEVLILVAQLEASGLETAEFDRRVANAATLLHLEEGSDHLATLIRDVEQAVRMSDRTSDLERRQVAAEAAIEDAENRLASTVSDLKPLIEFSPDSSPVEWRELLVRARTASRLRADIQEVEREIVDLGEGRDLVTLVNEVEGANPDDLVRDLAEIVARLEDANGVVEAQSAACKAAEIDFRTVGDGPDAAIAAFDMAQAKAEMSEQAEAYIRKRAELFVLKTAIERYRREKQTPLLERASVLFSTLTLGWFSGLTVDLDSDKPRLVGLRADGETVTPTEGMSEGTTDQLYLALRIAALEDLIDHGVCLPFVADDLFVNFDDERAAAGFRVLAELATKTQVLFFTHHTHLAGLAAATLHPRVIKVCNLDREVSGGQAVVAASSVSPLAPDPA